MTSALFVGRFQPFHKGHEHAIKHLFERFDYIVIAVGSTKKPGRDNPFTFDQRKAMIDAVLDRFKNRYHVIEVPDVSSDDKWKKYILSKAKFDTVVSRNPWTIKCFRGFIIMEQPLFEPRLYDASKIRKLIRGKEKNKWEELLPREVIGIVEKLKVPKKTAMKKSFSKIKRRK